MPPSAVTASATIRCTSADLPTSAQIGTAFPPGGFDQRDGFGCLLSVDVGNSDRCTFNGEKKSARPADPGTCCRDECALFRQALPRYCGHLVVFVL